MKITFFIGSMGRGGAERVISILANDYCSRGWDVDIVLLLQNKVEYLLDEHVRIVDITGKSSRYMKNTCYWLTGIRRYLKECKPDRVVSFVGRINALVLTASAGLRLPVIVSERNDPKNDGRGVIMRKYCNFVYHRAKRIVYQNEHEKSCFGKSLESRSCIIPNPVSAKTVREATADNTVVTAGRLIEQKNQAMLIRAMERVHKKFPQIKCRIYGDGVLREALQQQIHALGLDNTVTLEGNVSDIHDRLAQCGIFALTSNFEGLSNALIEAMMVGLPCITTNYPGAEELVTNGENGIVVPMDDDAALAEQIEKLIENKNDCAAKLAQRGQTDSAKFKAEVVLKQWHSVIED